MKIRVREGDPNDKGLYLHFIHDHIYEDIDGRKTMTFDLPLLKLQSEEIGSWYAPSDDWQLKRAGRFKRYRRQMQAHVVPMADNETAWRWDGVHAYFNEAEQMINWVHENTRGRWNMIVRDRNTPVHQNKKKFMFLDFSFEDVTDAVHFKMRWV
jgi:hypothetical protein